jgi:hypothetical protein
VAYALERTCHDLARRRRDAASTFLNRSYENVRLLERIDEYVAALGGALSFAESVREPFGDAPLPLPAQSDRPNVGFFSAGALRDFANGLRARAPHAHAAARATLARRLREAGDGGAAHLERLGACLRYCPAIDLTELFPGLDPSGAEPDDSAESYSLDLLRALVERLEESFEDDAEGTDGELLRRGAFLASWVAFCEAAVDDGLDVAFFEH